MSQPKSLDQMHQECCEELRRLDPGGGRPGPAVGKGGVEWLPLVVSTVWGLISITITYLVVWRPLKAELKQSRDATDRSRDATDKLREDVDKLRDALDKDLAERRTNSQSPFPSPVTLKLIEERKPSLQQSLAELRGKVGPEALDGARNRLYMVLAELGAPPMHAEEVVEIIIDVVVKPLVAPPDEPPAAPSPPLPA
jgi:hypothetical protein